MVEGPNKIAFEECLLFTHRGLSGPSILQISSYWQEGHDITVNLNPRKNVLDFLKEKKQSAARQKPASIISELLPARLGEALCIRVNAPERIADMPDKILKTLANYIQNWQIRPSGTEGYRTAEVTLGGVDTDALSSKTMQCKTVPGLFFIGEVVDVTGHLGGHNFQWAWSSGYVTGMNV